MNDEQRTPIVYPLTKAEVLWSRIIFGVAVVGLVGMLALIALANFGCL